jgi:Flp pilus assembly secretin CpaC
MRRTTFLVVALAATLSGGQALAGGVSVPMDEVRTVAFAKPVATVYVGNPAIADINMIDARHAFVLGKSFGTTNIIALDHWGRQVSNTYVSVSGSGGTTVTLLKGATQSTLSCTGRRCEVAPIPGDTRYSDVIGDVTKHQSLGATGR